MDVNPYDQFDPPDPEAEEQAPVDDVNPYEAFVHAAAKGPAAQKRRVNPHQGKSVNQIGLEDLKAAGTQIGDLLKSVGRVGSKVAGSLPLMGLDIGTALGNIGNQIMGQEQTAMPSEAFSRSLDQALPPPPGSGGAELGAELGAGLLMPSPALVTNTAPAAFKTAAQTAKELYSLRDAQRMRSVIDTGEKHGVPVFLDDLSRSALVKRLGVAGETLPFGTGPMRQRQSELAHEAAQQVQRKFADVADADIPPAIQESLGKKLGLFKKTVRVLNDRAQQALEPMGDIPIPRFRDALEKALDVQRQAGTLKNADVMGAAEKYLSSPALKEETRNIAGGLREPELNHTFSKLRALRSDLGREISDFYTGKNTAIGSKGVELLQGAKKALDQDIAEFAKGSGEQGYKAWRDANEFYIKNIVPFKETTLRTLVKSPEPEAAWRYLVAQGGVESRAVNMYNALDEPGRAAVRAGMLKEAMDKAVDGKGVFSPAKFARYIETHEDTAKTFFKGNDYQEIRGFANLMRHVDRAGSYAENPPTGQRLIPLLITGGAFFSPKTAASVSAAGAGISLMLQSPTGRDLLLAASKSKPGSKSMQALANAAQRHLVNEFAILKTRDSGE